MHLSVEQLSASEIERSTSSVDRITDYNGFCVLLLSVIWRQAAAIEQKAGDTEEMRVFKQADVRRPAA